MSCGIYQILNQKNDKRYVGSSSNIERRWKDHQKLLKARRHPNQHLQSAWLLYGGDAFSFQVLEEVPESNLLIREGHWATALESFNREKGYNLSVISPDARTSASPETRLKQRLKRLGKKQSPEAIAKTAAAHKGMKRSAETRLRIQKANQGQRMSDDQRKHLAQVKTGVPLSKDCRIKMSESKKGRIPIRLTEQEREDIRTRYLAGESRKQLSDEYGISPSYVSKIKYEGVTFKRADSRLKKGLSPVRKYIRRDKSVEDAKKLAGV